MDSIIETFHIDLKLLLAQAINFAIVFAVLYFFALKPLFKTMKERSVKIEKGLIDADKIEDKLRAIEEDRKNIIKEAKKEAAAIAAKAQEAGELKKEAMLARAKEEIGQIINQEKSKMQAEKAKTLKEMKQEMAELVMIALEKVLDKKIDSREDGEMIKKIIKQIK